MIDDSAVIQWFPGHMAQSMRKMAERVALVDVIIEVVDARLPSLSTNPFLDSVVGEKPRVMMLGREDLADPTLTGKWIAYEEQRGVRAIGVNGKQTGSVHHVLPILAEMTAGQKTLRAMVVGIPNTGKSTIINGLAKRTAARVENKAGVTRQLQWFRVSPTMEIMDTPGILVPKIATKEAQWQLALCGALPRERYDAEEVIARFNAWCIARKRDNFPTLEVFARERGFLSKGNVVNLHNASSAYLKDFNDGKFGRITFEEPPA
jgi:ribosome biogenesis GTPase A